MRLDSVTVLDATRLLPGPYATQVLADAGADVVKVEDTNQGDYARDMPPMSERNVGAIFDSMNRGKRSIALDLKTEEGKEVFYQIANNADVVIEQFRPGVVENLGIDYETILDYNQNIIYCSLTGYGQTGPYSDRAGHDLNYVGLSGLLDMTREDENSAPVIPGYLIGDVGGGLYAAMAILGALVSRELGNSSGEYIDVAMTDVVLTFSQSIAYEALTGRNPRPGKTTLTGEYPCYDVYECADGKFITFAALEARFWNVFCSEVGREDLLDKHMLQDPEKREDVRAELEEIFKKKSLDVWMDELSEETMTAPVNTPAEAVNHPQFANRDIIKESYDLPPRVGFPGLSSHSGENIPEQGEHTEAVLEEVGISPDMISELFEREIIK